MPQQAELEGEITIYPAATTITIDGINVNQFLVNYSVEHTSGEAMASFEGVFTKGVADFLNLVIGKAIQVYRYYPELGYSRRIFKGVVTKFEKFGGRYTINGQDDLINLTNRLVNHIYLSGDSQNGKISAIATDLIQTYGGLTPAVQDSGTVVVLDKFVCRRAGILERLQALANVLDWQVYYNQDEALVHFEPKGFRQNTNALTVGSELVDVPKWETNGSELINDVYIYGSTQNVGYIETFVATASQTTFTLSYTPVDVTVYDNGVLKQGSVDLNTTYDYYVDVANKNVIFTSGRTAGHTIEVDYTYPQPTPVHKQNSSSVAAYRRFQKFFNWTDVKSATDADVRATKILDRFSIPFKYATLKCRSITADDIRVGDTVHVIDSVNGVDDSFPVNKHVISYPSGYDELYVGERKWSDAEWSSTTDARLKRLEEQNLGQDDRVQEFLEGGANFTYRRYQLITKTKTLGTAWVLDNPNYWALDETRLLEDSGTVTTVDNILY